MRADLVRACALGFTIGLLHSGTAGAVAIVESTAFAFSDESGNDPGSEVDEAETAAPGVEVGAHALRCLGSAPCAVDPTDYASIGGHARARTDFGRNRAQAYGSSGPDPGVEDDVVSGGEASSLWIDEWTFSGLAGQTVSIELHLEGSWQNTGTSVFQAAVADSTLPPIHNPDDPNPFLDLAGQIVTSVSFDNRMTGAFDGVPPFFVPVPDGGEPDGNVDLALTLRFVPVPGRTYLVGARLQVAADGEEDDEGADFYSTAAVTRVVVPAGLSLASASGASWNVSVPEPSPGMLLLAALGGLAAVRSRARRGPGDVDRRRARPSS